MSDSEPLTKEDKHERDDLGKMCGDFFGRINFKVALILFMVGMLVFSDLFIDSILSNISGAEEAGNSTTKGTMIQLLILVILYLVADLLVQAGLI